jgi:hypothetical protein
VTVTPTGIPSRKLKLAIDLRARVTIAFCPVIMPSSFTTLSSNFWFFPASPIPQFTTTLLTRGT